MRDSTFSYRFADGVADAAAWTAIISILLTIFPTKTASVLSWTEVLTGLGYMIGIILFLVPCETQFPTFSIKLKGLVFSFDFITIIILS